MEAASKKTFQNSHGFSAIQRNGITSPDFFAGHVKNQIGWIQGDIKFGHHIFSRTCSNIQSKKIYVAFDFSLHPFHDGIAFNAANSGIRIDIQESWFAVPNVVKYSFCFQPGLPRFEPNPIEQQKCRDCRNEY